MKPNIRMAQKCSHSGMVHCSTCHQKPFPEILMSGYLIKSPPLNKSVLKRWKTRYFILRADASLEYYEGYRAVVPLGVIDLERTQRLEAGLETKKYSNIFDLIMPGRTYFFSAGQLEIMFDWVTQIKRILGIGEDVVYPQKGAPKPLTASSLLMQVYVNPACVPSRPSRNQDMDRSNSPDSGDGQAPRIAEMEFRASLIRSNHYTVLQRRKAPAPPTEAPLTEETGAHKEETGAHKEETGAHKEETGTPLEEAEVASGSYQGLDSLDIQWSDRAGSFTKLKELILSTGKGVIPSPAPTRFYSMDELSGPEYATVQRPGNGHEQLELKKSQSFDESYDPNPPPVPPKFRPKSPMPPLQLELRQRLPSLGKMRRIRVSGSAKEGVGTFSLEGPAATDDSDVVCFGAIVKKVFGCLGGRICFRESHIEVEVPPGAISEGHIQGFYFKVSPDPGFLEERREDGYAAHVCSPLLQFGPVGAKFQEPIRIRMPHCLNLDVEDYHVQLIFAYGDVFSPNGLNYVRIDVCKEDLELEMFSFNTILGPVVFNLQPESVILEISHFVFQWVQLVGLSRCARPTREPYSVCKRLRLACFLRGGGSPRPALALYLYNDYNDVFAKILESELPGHSQFLCESEPLSLCCEQRACLAVAELEFGYRVSGSCKQPAAVPTLGETHRRCLFQLEKLFESAGAFSCELRLCVGDRLLAALDLEAGQPQRRGPEPRGQTAPGRQQELAETLGLSGSSESRYPLSLLTEAHRKYGCELERVSEALRQLDAAELLLSPSSPRN